MKEDLCLNSMGLSGVHGSFFDGPSMIPNKTPRIPLKALYDPGVTKVPLCFICSCEGLHQLWGSSWGTYNTKIGRPSPRDAEHIHYGDMILG